MFLTVPIIISSTKQTTPFQILSTRSVTWALPTPPASLPLYARHPAKNIDKRQLAHLKKSAL
jgi:hypothetical protein